MISCQVCWRTMRWHNGQIRRSLNPHPDKVFQDCDSKWEESVAHSILARRLFTPTKAVYMSADQPCPSHFSLAIRRRTIHVRIRRHSGVGRKRTSARISLETTIFRPLEEHERLDWPLLKSVPDATSGGASDGTQTREPTIAPTSIKTPRVAAA